MTSRILSRSLLPRFSPLLRGGAPMTLRQILWTNPIRRPPTIRFTATSAPNGTPAPAPSLSQRFKALSKEYGYSAIGVYIALSALDFPFCFLAVRYLGAERVGKWEEVIVDYLKPYWNMLRHTVGLPPAQEVPVAPGEEGHNGRDDRDDSEEKSASIWAELALAYAIHKSFIFIRVPLTAAVTPKVVKVLRGWGWNIGKKGKSKVSMPGKKGTPPPPVV